MAPLPDHMVPKIEDAFLADRTNFWTSFTNATKFAVIALVVLLVGMWLFIA